MNVLILNYLHFFMKRNIFYFVSFIVLLVVPGQESSAQRNVGKDLLAKEEVPAENGTYTFDIKQGVCTGLNFDVENIGTRFCLATNKYYELDSVGTILLTDESVVDKGQDGYDFGPAIAVSPDSTVHLVSRGSGNKSTGFSLLYSKKKIGHEWQVSNKLVGRPIVRNYIVDIVASGDSAIYGHSHEVNDVNSTIHFYALKNGQCDSLGAFRSSSYFRSDSDFRMKVYKDSMFLVTGYPWPDGSVFYMHGKLSANLPKDLESSRIPYKGGLSRKGQPDVSIDGRGTVHFTYGAKNAVYYCSVRQNKGIITNTLTMNELGDWHMSYGLSSLAVSNDGKTLLVVGLKTDGSKLAANSDILWAISTDAGVSWTYPKSLGVSTSGWEGRCRPRLLRSGNSFYLFYYDNAVKKISMAIMKFGPSSISKAVAPVIGPDSPAHNNPVEIVLGAESGARLFFTTNGSNPSAFGSAQYTAPSGFYYVKARVGDQEKMFKISQIGS